MGIMLSTHVGVNSNSLQGRVPDNIFINLSWINIPCLTGGTKQLGVEESQTLQEVDCWH